MHLQAALAPPSSVTTPLTEVVAAAVAATASSVLPEPEREPVGAGGGFFRRRKVPEPVVLAPLAPMLTPVRADQVHLLLVRFGFVSRPDLPRLRRTLAATVEDLPPATVWVRGGDALTPDGDRNVWAQLEGDVDGLSRIFRTVNEAVEAVGFFLDRRSFRPRLAVGEITATTSAECLEHLVAGLEGFRSEPWTVDGVSLMKRILERQPSEVAEMEHFPLGGSS